MGTLTYNSTLAIQLEDRVLLHLQTVVGAKLRRREPFYFTWRTGGNDAGQADGTPQQTTIWLHEAVGLEFTYLDAATTAVNRDWLEALMVTANSPSGLHIVPEPVETERMPVPASAAAPATTRR